MSSDEYGFAAAVRRHRQEVQDGSVPVHTSGLVKAVSAPIRGNQVVYRTPTESDASTRVCTCMLMSVDNSN